MPIDQRLYSLRLLRVFISVDIRENGQRGRRVWVTNVVTVIAGEFPDPGPMEYQ